LRKVPELIVFKFEGDITQYISFKKAFHLKFDKLLIPPCEKLGHLKSHVQGQPLSIIKHLDLVDANYDRAFSELDLEYDKPDEVILTLYHRVYAQPRATKETASLGSTYFALQGLISTLESHSQMVDKLTTLLGHQPKHPRKSSGWNWMSLILH